MFKTDLKFLRRGFKRMVLALLTAAAFALAVYGFIVVAGSTGYLAVLQLIVSITMLLLALSLMYVLGIC